MSVSTSEELSQGLFTPFFQEVRGGHDGKSPVGTVHVNISDVGEAGGGTVSLNLFMSRLTFGFRAIIAPTLIVTADNLAAAEAVRLGFAIGNLRLGVGLFEAELAVASEGGNRARFEPSGFVLQHDEVSSDVVMSVVWSTNTDTKVYDVDMFAAVFDAEVIEKHGSISDFLAGVR